jgi:hypothetical protein
LGEFRLAKVTQFAPETGRLYTTKSQTWVGLYKVIHHTVPGLTLSLVFLPQPTLAQNTTPQIQISVADPLLEQNIRAHIGVPAERCNTRQNRLNRLLPGIRRDIDRAVQAQSIDLTFTVEQ